MTRDTPQEPDRFSRETPEWRDPELEAELEAFLADKHAERDARPTAAEPTGAEAMGDADRLLDLEDDDRRPDAGDVVGARADEVAAREGLEGRWVIPGVTPGVPQRTHGDPVNLDYEEWTRRVTGGPSGQEFQRGRACFDAVETRVVGGERVQVLIEAKGRYEQFIDPATGDWQPWFTRGGLKEMVGQADRQVEAAGGCPVEWWCAEESVAWLLNKAFERAEIEGITAVYRRMEG